MKIKQIEGLQAALDQAGTGTTIGAGKRGYDTTTTEPPSSGQLRLNNVDPNLATEAYVHDSDGTTDWSGLLNKAVAGSVLKAIKDDSNYWMFDITEKTDETGYVKYAISPLVIVGTISNEDEVTIELDVSGAVDISGKVDKQAVNGDAFTGALNFSNIQGTYHSDYDLSTIGTITFSIASSLTFGFVYVRIISDGITPFASQVNFDSIFDEQYGIPDDFILESGVYAMYMWKTPGGGGISIPANTGSVSTDNAPYATSVVIDNVMPSENAVLNGSYTYNDLDGDTESGTTVKWQIADDSDGTNLADITGATSSSYTVLSGDIGKRLRFAVRPSNANGTGSWYYSSWTSEVTSADVSPPVASFDPANSASDIAVDTQIIVTINEAIRKTDGTTLDDTNIADIIALKVNNSSGADIPFSATIDGGKTIITITPDADLSSGSAIYVAVNNFEDFVGNEVATPQSAIFTTAGSAESLPLFENSLLYVDASYANNIVESSGRVVQWNDRVTPGRYFAEVGSRGGTYNSGAKSIDMVGNDLYQLNTDVICSNRNLTLTLIWKKTGSGTYIFRTSENTWYMTVASGTFIQYFDLNGTLRAWSDSGLVSDYFYTPKIMSVVHDHANNQVLYYVNGAGPLRTISSANLADVTHAFRNIGRYTTAGVTTNLDICAIDIKNIPLTSGEIATLHAYLNSIHSIY